MKENMKLYQQNKHNNYVNKLFKAHNDFIYKQTAFVSETNASRKRDHSLTAKLDIDHLQFGTQHEFKRTQ